MTKVLIVGATGLVGSYLVSACKEAGHEIRVLVRPETLLDNKRIVPLKASGAMIIEGSLEDYDSLIKACDGVDVVISAVNGPGIPLQTELIKAAKECKVGRFIPSDFGIDPKIAGEGSCILVDQKVTIQSAVKKSGLNFTFIHSNGFFEYWLYSLGQVGLTAPPEEVEYYGDHSLKMALASVYDIARVTAATLDDPRTLNRELAIFVNAHTQEELIQLWEDVSGKQIKRIPVSIEDLEKVIAASTTPETFIDLLLAQLKRSAWFMSGAGKVAENALDATALYPEIKYTSPSEALIQVAKVG